MVEAEEKKVTSLSGFACSCGDEGKEKMKEIIAWAVKHIHGDREQKYPNHFVTQILYALTDYKVWIESIPVDPGGWGAIIAEGGPKDDKISTFIQFDRFEDGLALTLKKVVEYFRDKKITDDEDDE